MNIKEFQEAAKQLERDHAERGNYSAATKVRREAAIFASAAAELGASEVGPDFFERYCESVYKVHTDRAARVHTEHAPMADEIGWRKRREVERTLGPIFGPASPKCGGAYWSTQYAAKMRQK